MARAFSKDAFHIFAEGVFFFERNVGLYGAGEASAVHADCAFSGKDAAGQLY